ncbi:hypothetical protein NV379_00315 [Paenibacillus sp. N1-5-1-14]|nr:hypothetical protein [Paenibacillus radicibacter]
MLNRPPHLPKQLLPSTGYWIFYCHTNHDYRGQGCYRRTLYELYQLILQTQLHPDIYVDTDLGNNASHRGIVSSGFERIGCVQSRYLVLLNTWIPINAKWGESI